LNVTGDEHAELMNLYSQYNLSGDVGDPDVYASCYAADGVLIINGNTIGRGREQLSAFMRTRQAARGGKYRRHWNGSIHFEKSEAGTILGRCYLQIFTGVPGSLPILTDAFVYEDVIVNEEGSWKFASRTLTSDYQTT
jgi:hypothetical protein